MYPHLPLIYQKQRCLTLILQKEDKKTISSIFIVSCYTLTMSEEFKKIKDRSGDELVSVLVDLHGEVSSDVIHAELMRRNTEAMVESKKSADRFSYVTSGLTLIMIALVLVQIFFSIYTADLNTFLKWAIAILFIVFVIIVFRGFIKDIDR